MDQCLYSMSYMEASMSDFCRAPRLNRNAADARNPGRGRAVVAHFRKNGNDRKCAGLEEGAGRDGATPSSMRVKPARAGRRRAMPKAGVGSAPDWTKVSPPVVGRVSVPDP